MKMKPMKSKNTIEYRIFLWLSIKNCAFGVSSIYKKFCHYTNSDILLQIFEPHYIQFIFSILFFYHFSIFHCRFFKITSFPFASAAVGEYRELLSSFSKSYTSWIYFRLFCVVCAWNYEDEKSNCVRNHSRQIVSFDKNNVCERSFFALHVLKS